MQMTAQFQADWLEH